MVSTLQDIHGRRCSAVIAVVASGRRRDLLATKVHRCVLVAGMTLYVIGRNVLVHMNTKCGERRPRSSASGPCRLHVRGILEHDDDLRAVSSRRPPRGADAVVAGRPSNDSTCNAIVGACTRLGALNAGMWVHAYYFGRRTDGMLPLPCGVGDNALIDILMVMASCLRHNVENMAARDEVPSYLWTVSMTHMCASSSASEARPSAIGIHLQTVSCDHIYGQLRIASHKTNLGLPTVHPGNKMSCKMKQICNI